MGKDTSDDEEEDRIFGVVHVEDSNLVYKY